MINLNIPRAWDVHPSYYMPLLQHRPLPPPGLAPLGAATLENPPVQAPLTTVPRPPQPPPLPSTPPQCPALHPPQHPNSVSSGPNFIVDAETAIENAPFIELGRHALAQNWCCVKISNVLNPFINLECRRFSQLQLNRSVQIPYSVTGENIMEFLGKNAKVVPEEIGLSVHIIMDRASVYSAIYTPYLSLCSLTQLMDRAKRWMHLLNSLARRMHIVVLLESVERYSGPDMLS